jgi:hypothetical protein
MRNTTALLLFICVLCCKTEAHEGVDILPTPEVLLGSKSGPTACATLFGRGKEEHVKGRPDAPEFTWCRTGDGSAWVCVNGNPYGWIRCAELESVRDPWKNAEVPSKGNTK